MSHKLLRNYGSILVYQFVTILTPLVTTPYISRILGPKGIGLEAYLYSFIQLFSLLILLGLPMYASKKIAETDERNMNQLFSELFSFQIIMTGATTSLYGLFIFYFNQHQFLLVLYLFTLISTGLDTSWYFVGKEKISAIMWRNIAVRVCNIGAIFLFIQTSNDLWKYILINGLTLFLGQFLTGSIALSEVGGFTFVVRTIGQHISPIVLLFVVPSMLTLTLSINKLLLENFNGAVEVGVFNQAYKLYVIAISFISALTSVLMPKMSKYYTTGDTERLKKYLNFSLRFISGLALPMTIGVLVMAPQFVSWFLGEEFSEVMNPLVIISFSFVFKGLSDVIGIQYLVVSNKNKEYALAVIVGAVVTSSCCFLFLQLNFKAQAPALALFVGTAVTLLIELYQVRKVVSFMFVGKYLIKYAVFSLIMGGCMWGASRSIEIERTSLYLVTQVGVGVISYSICFILSKDPLIQLIKRKKREI